MMLKATCISHFGSDTAGVNTTRRYLCEALSFQYRYIPIGLLERLPARINERAPSFKGRDELGGYKSSLFTGSELINMAQKRSWRAETAATG